MEVRKEIQDALEAARNANGKKEERKKVKADEKLDRLEEVRSPEMEAIYKKFLLAANSEAAIGLGKGARTGRGSSKKVSEDDEDLPVAKSLARNETHVARLCVRGKRSDDWTEKNAAGNNGRVLHTTEGQNYKALHATIQ